jgi:hypothetical protein
MGQGPRIVPQWPCLIGHALHQARQHQLDALDNANSTHDGDGIPLCRGGGDRCPSQGRSKGRRCARSHPSPTPGAQKPPLGVPRKNLWGGVLMRRRDLGRFRVVGLHDGAGRTGLRCARPALRQRHQSTIGLPRIIASRPHQRDPGTATAIDVGNSSCRCRTRSAPGTSTPHSCDHATFSDCLRIGRAGQPTHRTDMLGRAR